jgi:hypothetical protein
MERPGKHRRCLGQTRVCEILVRTEQHPPHPPLLMNGHRDCTRLQCLPFNARPSSFNVLKFYPLILDFLSTVAL